MTTKRLVCGVAVLMLCPLLRGRAEDVPVPTTPAGVALRAWLSAFDSFNRAAVERYTMQFEPKANVDGMLGFARAVGGFHLVGVDGHDPLTVRFRVIDGNGMDGAGTLRVTRTQPHTVEQVGVQLVPKNAKVEWRPIDAAERKKVIARASAALDEFYTDPQLARKMASAVAAKEQHGAYDEVTDGAIFADKLGEDMRTVSRDGHLSVGYSPVVDDGLPTAGDGNDAEAQSHMLKENCGFEKADVLPHNIGYVKVNYFGDPVVCGSVAASAMAMVSHADALIFDLRENQGGDPGMVQVLASWLFERTVHVNDLVDRQAKSTTQYWTLPWVPGLRMAKQPVYVLTSHGTFSGGEEFAYDLQTQKRAKIIGEATGGGAHPVQDHRLDEHFSMGVPFAHPVNPVTGKDWEGTGVVPDVTVASKDALERAQQMADAELAKTAKAITN